MPGAGGYPEGTTALSTDSEQRSLVKIVSLLNPGGGGGSVQQVFPIAGSGSPSGVPSGGGYAYNDVGDRWIYTSSGWEKIASAPV